MLEMSDQSAAKGFSFSVRPTPLVKHNGMRILRATFANSERTTKIWIEYRAKGITRIYNIALSGTEKEIFDFEVPDVKAPTQATFVAATKIGKSAFAHCEIMPARELELHVMMGAHTDVGYTDLPHHVAEIHRMNIERALEYCDLTDNWPEEIRFRFTAESAWQVDEFIKTRSKSLIKKLVSRMRQGRIAMNALYLNTLTGMATPETLIRLLHFSNNFERTHNVTCRTAYQTDVPAYSWSLCNVLVHAGIKYLSTALNMDRASFERNTEIITPFYWESPEGGRVLTWFNYQYGIYEYGLRWPLPETQKNLIDYLERRFPPNRYPYDMIFLHCYFSDNQRISFDIMNRMKEWNETFKWPRFFCSTPDMFLPRFEQKYKDQIPVHRGDWGTFWEDGIGSGAKIISRYMETQADLGQAERFASFALISDKDAPSFRNELDTAYQNALLFNEHTWGHHDSVYKPTDPLVKKSWDAKARFASRGQQANNRVLNTSLDFLSGRLATKTNPRIVVWNSLSWNRTGLVRMRLPYGMAAFALVDMTTELPTPYQLENSGKIILFVAQDVPQLGYKQYELIPLSESQTNSIKSKSLPKTNAIENSLYRVVASENYTGLSSIVDLKSGNDLVNTGHQFAFGQIVYDEGEPPHNTRVKAFNGSLIGARNGSVYSQMHLRNSAPTCPRIDLTVRLYNNIPQIDLLVTLNKEPCLAKEAVYVTFPFARWLKNIRCELALANIIPDSDQLSGACRDWFTVMGPVSVSSDNQSALLVSPNAPLMQFGDIQVGKWLKRLEIETPTIFSYIMNNYWHTNYRASQDKGWHRFAYSVIPSNDYANIASTHRSGQEILRPLIGRFIEPHQDGLWHEPTASMLTLESNDYAVIGLGYSVDGKDLIVRLLKLSDKDSLPVLRVGKNIINAENLSIIEETPEYLHASGTHCIVTLKVRLY